MANKQTIYANILTDFDKQVLELCEKILETIYNSIDKTKFSNIEYIENLYFEIKKYALFQNLNQFLENENSQTTLCWKSDEKNINTCNWYDSVEVFAFLGISVAINFFETNFDYLYSKIEKILNSQQIDTKIKLPQSLFPNQSEEYIICPLCKTSISNGISDLFDNKLDSVFLRIAPVYLKTKIDENQHNAKNVRFAHKWCSSILNSRSVDATIFTLSDILKSHGKDLPVLQNETNEVSFLKYHLETKHQNIATAIRQYFDYFSEYVKLVKGKEIYFYVKPLKDGFEFIARPDDKEIIEIYLQEYTSLVNQKLEDLILNFENKDITTYHKKIATVEMKSEIQKLNFMIEVRNAQMEDQQKQMEEYKKMLNKVVDAFREEAKKPIHISNTIVNQTISLQEIKQLINELFSEFTKINTIRLTEEERIFDYYSRLDKIVIQNSLDYQKRINQWLPEYSKLNNLSQTYLLSAEFLFDALFKADANDYSPFVLQYCRVLENELLKNLFVGFYNYLRNLKTDIQIQTDYSWDFAKANKNSEFAKLFLRTEEPEIMLAKIIAFLKNSIDTNFSSSLLFNDFKNFIDTIFDKNKILEQSFIDKIDFVRENYRNKAAHPDKNTIKLNLSEAQKCQTLVREILKIWLENKR